MVVIYMWCNLRKLLAERTQFGLSVAVRDTGGSIQRLPQTISLLTERWGGFVQASYKFGELRTLRY